MAEWVITTPVTDVTVKAERYLIADDGCLHLLGGPHGADLGASFPQGGWLYIRRAEIPVRSYIRMPWAIMNFKPDPTIADSGR